MKETKHVLEKQTKIQTQLHREATTLLEAAGTEVKHIDLLHSKVARTTEIVKDNEAVVSSAITVVVDELREARDTVSCFGTAVESEIQGLRDSVNEFSSEAAAVNRAFAATISELEVAATNCAAEIATTGESFATTSVAYAESATAASNARSENETERIASLISEKFGSAISHLKDLIKTQTDASLKLAAEVSFDSMCCK